jgi:hypothetical protein
MKSRFLFPHQWMVRGIILFIAGLICFIIQQQYFFEIDAWLHSHSPVAGLDSQVLLDDVVYLSLVAGLLLAAFSKEKIEDEQIAQLRSDSLQWAIYVNYGIFIVCTIFINGTDYLSVIMYNVLSPLLFFMIRFRWKMYLLNRSLKTEEAV